jgi:hypothetical protein
MAKTTRAERRAKRAKEIAKLERAPTPAAIKSRLAWLWEALRRAKGLGNTLAADHAGRLIARGAA